MWGLFLTQTYTLAPDKLAKAVAYAAARNRLHFAAAAYGIALLIGLLSLRVAPRFRDWAERLSRHLILQSLVLGALLSLVVDGLSLPVSLWGHHLSLEYEQSVQGWGSWLWDWSKGEAIGAVMAGAGLWILYALIRRSPRRWWFYGWLVSLPILLFLQFVIPLAIDPLFFRFEPLEPRHPELAAQIERVVARGRLDIPAGRMYEMNASTKLNSLNAYVTGLGASKRVVVWDTTIRRMTTPQILFVFGHEMGHYVLGHTWILLSAACFGLLIFLFVGFHAMRRALGRWGPRWRIRGMDDLASVLVLMLTASILGFLAEPVENSFSRMLEHRADVYGLEAIHGIVADSSQTAAQAFQIMGEIGLSDPNPSPFIQFWLYDHPSISDRVRFAAEYVPRN